MGDNQRPLVNIKIDLWWLAPFIVLLFFCGEPDLMDAIIYRLMECP